ncbi:hypothetical protein V8F20_011205 [Naviculisporaceae sp. PSN 640]
MTSSLDFDWSTSPYSWCSFDEADFSGSSFMGPEDYDFDYGYDTHPDITALISSRKYFASRVPFRSDGNPRGKFPRKPLPWPSIKLSAAQDASLDADQYRKRLWQWELQQKQKSRQSCENSSLRDCIADDSQHSSPPTPRRGEKVVRNGTNINKHYKSDPRSGIGSRISRKARKKARRERIKAQKASERRLNKPRFERPQYLLLNLDAMRRKKGWQKSWSSCPICDRVREEWDGVMKPKSRDLATKSEDGLWEAKNEYLALDIYNDDGYAIRGCDCGSCRAGLTVDPDSYRAHIPSWMAVDTADLLGRETFRVRYVDQIGRGKGERKKTHGPKAVQEKKDVARSLMGDLKASSCNEQMSTQDINYTELSDGVDSDILSEEWDLVDGSGLDACESSLQGDVTRDSGRETHRRGWTIDWLLGRWFS